MELYIIARAFICIVVGLTVLAIATWIVAFTIGFGYPTGVDAYQEYKRKKVELYERFKSDQ